MSEWTFVAAAYGLSWTALAGYAVYLLRRRTRARAQLAQVQQNPGDIP